MTGNVEREEYDNYKIGKDISLEEMEELRKTRDERLKRLKEYKNEHSWMKNDDPK